MFCVEELGGRAVDPSADGGGTEAEQIPCVVLRRVTSSMAL